MVNFSLEGRVALVTGAAYGIGLAIATAFAEAGAKIVFNCSRQETVDRGMEAYRKLGIDARGYLCDVTDEEAVRNMVTDIEKTVGTIDILVNNAGIIKRIPMEEMKAEDFRKVIDIDLVGPFICAKAVIPGMIKKGHGKIINICSMMSELGRETVSAYAAAKGGLKMLTRNICSEFTHHRADVDYLAVSFLYHAGNHGLGADEGAHEIYIYHLSEILRLHLLHGDALDNAGVVDEDVDCSYRLLDIRHHVSDSFLVGDIAEIAPGIDAELAVSLHATVDSLLT